MTRVSEKISVKVSNGTEVKHLPEVCSFYSDGNGKMKAKIDKASKKRFIKVAMALGFPARTARGMANVVRDMGRSYTEGLYLLVGFVYENAPNVPAYLWAKTMKDIGIPV